MYVQQAHELFARRPDRSRFQVHISFQFLVDGVLARMILFLIAILAH